MEQNYKLVCIDLDGTLLDAHHKINPFTLEVLRTLEKKGIKLAIATGRDGFDAKHHAQIISKDCFYIGSNGAVVGEARHNNLLAENVISQESVFEVLQFAKKNNIKTVITTPKGMYISGFKLFMSFFTFAITKHIHWLKQMHYCHNLEQLPPKMANGNLQVYKIVLFASSDQAEYINTVTEKMESIEVARTSYDSFELTAKGINKSVGVDALIKHLGIAKEEVIAFGDSENDREMLKFVGLGIAMDNASASIKSIANQVTIKNTEDGVAKKLQELFSLT